MSSIKNTAVAASSIPTPEPGKFAYFTDIANNQYSVKDSTGAVTIVSADTSLPSQVTSNTTNIGNNTADISTNSASINVNTVAITANAASISTEVTDRTTADTNLQGQIDSNVIDITDLNNEQVVQDGRLDTLELHPPLTNNPHSTTVLNLSDMGSTSYAPNSFYTLRSNAAGDEVELFQMFEQGASRTDPLLHQPNTFAQYLTMTVNIPVQGDYLFYMGHRFSINSTTVNFESHLLFDGDFFLITHIEMKDSAGIGITVPNTTGGNTGTGTDNFLTKTGFVRFENLPAGSHNFTLEWRGQTANQEATIYEAEMFIKRILS